MPPQRETKLLLTSKLIAEAAYKLIDTTETFLEDSKCLWSFQYRPFDLLLG